MKRSLPRLERLLKLRQQEETVTARELGRAIQDEDEARRARDEASSRVERCAEQVDSSAKERVTSAGVLRNLDLSVRAANAEAEEAEKNHRSTEEKVAAAQDEYSEDRKERRVMERLRDRVRKEKTTDEARREQKESDGLSQLRWLLRR